MFKCCCSKSKLKYLDDTDQNVSYYYQNTLKLGRNLVRTTWGCSVTKILPRGEHLLKPKVSKPWCPLYLHTTLIKNWARVITILSWLLALMKLIFSLIPHLDPPETGLGNAVLMLILVDIQADAQLFLGVAQVVWCFLSLCFGRGSNFAFPQ